MPRHILHVGFPKCGSTALQGWFAAHPDVAFAHSRLTGYYSTVDFARRTALGESEPEVIVTSHEDFVVPLAQIPVSEYRPPADISVQRERVCLRLRDLHPDADVLIVTRGYHGVLTSTYADYVGRGGTLGRSELLGLRGAGQSENDVEATFDYDAVVSLYERVFGPERVLVMPYELLRDDPGEFVRQLEERFGVGNSGRIPERLRVSISPAELTWYPRLSRFVHRASAPLGRHRNRVVEMYRVLLKRRKLRRLAQALARVTPPSMNLPPPKISSEMLDRFYPRAAQLVARPAYAPYRSEYVDGTSIS
jgi:hypothetical protein